MDSCIMFCREPRLWAPHLQDVGAPVSRAWGSGWPVGSSGLPRVDGSPRDALGSLDGPALTGLTPTQLAWTLAISS